jgi:hypothetical protein
VGSLAVQLAASDAQGGRITTEAVRGWAKRLCEE